MPGQAPGQLFNLPRGTRAMGRLLLIADRFPPDLGGVARSASRIATLLHGSGVDVEVLAWTRTLPPGQLESVPVPVASEVPGGTPQPGQAPLLLHRVGLFSNQDFSLQHTQNIVEWLHSQRPYQAIWGHYLYPAGYMAVMLARWLSIKSTISARGNDIDRMMFPPGDFARLTWTLRHTDAITAVSRDLARKIALLIEVAAPVTVLGNSVDLETFTPEPPDATLRQALGIPENERVLGFCGELRQKKGFPFLLTALAEVNHTLPARLLVIGEVRPREQDGLSEFLLEHPELEERIIITGNLDAPRDVARHLRLCDIVLHPSVWDGLPNALLESMACGCVVIGSDAGGIPEVIEHDVSGYLIPRAELARLGEAVLEVLQLPADRRAALGAAARERVANHFCAEREVEALRPVLLKLGL